MTLAWTLRKLQDIRSGLGRTQTYGLLICRSDVLSASCSRLLHEALASIRGAGPCVLPANLHCYGGRCRVRTSNLYRVRRSRANKALLHKDSASISGTRLCFAFLLQNVLF